MKYIINMGLIIAAIFMLQACTKTESDFTVSEKEMITVNASTVNVTTGVAVSFLVLSTTNNNVTANSKVYVNGNLIAGNRFIFADAGNFAVYATNGTLTSNVITIKVTAATTSLGYKHHVLVEEYSGTWCGNCPRILYGVDLLQQQTNQAIVVSTHLFNKDPFITTDGNNLAAQQGVSGVPAGNINRTLSWTGPQYENVAQVINTIQAAAPVGIAISSVLSNATVTVSVKTGYTQAFTGNAKLTVYLVEDKLFYTQQNYSLNLYGGQASIPNFEYNGVLRQVISSLSGDAVGTTANGNEKSYSFIPANVSNSNNTRIVAFISNSAGTVVNVQEAKVGEVKGFEVF